MSAKWYQAIRLLCGLLTALVLLVVTWPVTYSYLTVKLNSSADVVIETLGIAELPMPAWVGRPNYNRWLNEAAVEVFKPNVPFVGVSLKADGQYVTLGWPVGQPELSEASLAENIKRLRLVQLEKLLSAPVGYNLARLRELENIKKNTVSQYKHLRGTLIDASKISKNAKIQKDLLLSGIDDKLLFTVGEEKLKKAIDALTLVIEQPERYVREAINIQAEQQRYKLKIDAFKLNYPQISYIVIAEGPPDNGILPLVRVFVVSGIAGLLVYLFLRRKLFVQIYSALLCFIH